MQAVSLRRRCRRRHRLRDRHCRDDSHRSRHISYINLNRGHDRRRSDGSGARVRVRAVRRARSRGSRIFASQILIPELI